MHAARRLRKRRTDLRTVSLSRSSLIVSSAVLSSATFCGFGFRMVHRSTVVKQLKRSLPVYQASQSRLYQTLSVAALAAYVYRNLLHNTRDGSRGPAGDWEREPGHTEAENVVLY